MTMTVRVAPASRFAPSAYFTRVLLIVFSAVTLEAASPWPAVNSDRTQDPAVVEGALENGLRYRVLSNAEPPGRVSLRLVVAAGSREEREDERGLAHFVEHMAFRGSRNLPRGAMMPALERLGVAPGADNTAFTYYDHTTYLLELPEAGAASLKRGLEIYRDFAEGISFDADLVDLERAVILNEKAIASSPQTREIDANRLFLWPTAREMYRSPIGLAQVLERATREQLIAFYDAWYRPERMAILVVGDIAAPEAVDLIREVFGSLKARGQPRPEPSGLVASESGPDRVRIYREPGINGVGFVFQQPVRAPRKPDTAANRRENLVRGVAFSMFQWRLREASSASDSPLAGPSANYSSQVQDWELASLATSGRIDLWRPALEAMERELRRALLHGFTESEMRRVRASYRSTLDQSVRIEPNRDSTSLISELESGILEGNPFVKMSSMRDQALAALDSITLEECHRSFVAAWGTEPYKVYIGTNPGFSPTADEITAVLTASAQVAVAPPADRPVPEFAYTDFGIPGRLRRDHLDQALGVRLAEFENRVRLNFKPTDFDRGFVSAVVRVGEGRFRQPARGIADFAQLAFTEGGTGRHSLNDLMAILAGTSVTVTFGVVEDGFLFSLRSSREELPLALRVVSAYLTDPGFRPDQIRDVHSSISGIYSRIAASPAGPIRAQLEHVLTGGDIRFGTPERDDFAGRSYPELAAWLKPILAKAGVEVSVVGDIAWPEVVSAVAGNLGALAKRDDPAPAGSRAVEFAPRGGGRVFRFTNSQRQASLALVLPVTDVVEVKDERLCYLLAAVLDERLRIALREELGATYTPSVSFVEHEAYQGFDYFLLTADVLPAHLDRLGQAMSAELGRLLDDGIDEDLLLRVQAPGRREREADLRDNRYWLYGVLDGVQSRPEKLAAARTRIDGYAALTAPELEEMARRYLKPERAFTFTAVPEP